MSTGKVRYIDYSPDNFLVGCAGMTAEQIGVYWVVCSLIYSGRKPIDENDERIWKLGGITARRWPGMKKELLEKGKLTLAEGQLVNGRSLEELASATKRITASQENGKHGGRPRRDVSAPPEGGNSPDNTPETQPNTPRSQPDQQALAQPTGKEHKDLAKPTGSAENNLSTNHQPSLPVPPVSPPKGPAHLEAERKAEFDRWYALYPRKCDPGRARRAFDKARKKATLEQLCNGAQRYAEEHRRKGTEKEWLKHPSTWLNAESWLNEPDSGGDLLARSTGNLPDTADFRTWVPRIREFKAKTVWLTSYGPKRGDPGCIIPKAVLDRWDEI